MHERALVIVKVEPRSTSRLNSALFIFPLFYLRDSNLHALTCVPKHAPVNLMTEHFISHLGVKLSRLFFRL